jgi:hypothetical protein
MRPGASRKSQASWLGRGSRQDRSHAVRRGRSEAKSLGGDESGPIIDDVMVRVSSARDVAPLERDRETCSLLVLGPITRERSPDDS